MFQGIANFYPACMEVMLVIIHLKEIAFWSLGHTTVYDWPFPHCPDSKGQIEVE